MDSLALVMAIEVESNSLLHTNLDKLLKRNKK